MCRTYQVQHIGERVAVIPQHTGHQAACVSTTLHDFATG